MGNQIYLAQVVQGHSTWHSLSSLTFFPRMAPGFPYRPRKYARLPLDGSVFASAGSRAPQTTFPKNYMCDDVSKVHSRHHIGHVTSPRNRVFLSGGTESIPYNLHRRHPRNRLMADDTLDPYPCRRESAFFAEQAIRAFISASSQPFLYQGARLLRCEVVEACCSGSEGRVVYTKNQSFSIANSSCPAVIAHTPPPYTDYIGQSKRGYADT